MRSHLKTHHEIKARMFDLPEDEEMATNRQSDKGKPEAVAWGEELTDEINRMVALFCVVHGRPFQMLRDEVFGDLVRKLSVDRYSPCST
jgi:hypothetical protein